MKTLPKRRYGQHFLRDTGVLSRIVSLLRPGASDLVLEIGAGDGALSVRLAPRVFRLLALEIDQDLIPALTLTLTPYANAESIRKDILHADLPALVQSYLAPGIRLRIVGNLPYNIGTPIIQKVIKTPLAVHDMTFMLQLETVQRICAAPGSEEYGYFSVYCQHYCAIEFGFKVAPACFVPRPKVYSAVVTLRPRNLPRAPGIENSFQEIAKAAFAYRRKTLINSLERHPRFGPVASDLLGKAGIDGKRRAEDLTVEEYERLALWADDRGEGVKGGRGEGG